MNFNQKKILLLIPKFKSYEDYIVKEIENRGGKTYFVAENIDTRFFLYKIFSKIFPRQKYNLAEVLYEYQIKKIKDDLDYFLVIKGANLSIKYLSRLRKKFPRAKFILYQWDSVALNRNSEAICKYFDKVLTFDYEDAQKNDWEYRPLFYIDDFISTQKRQRYDLSYITTLVPGRIEIFLKLKEVCEDKGIKLFAYLTTSLHSYIYHRYVLRDYSFKRALKHIHVRNLPLEITHKIYDDSLCIIDYTRPEQNGFTMRTIEAIGHQCKIVTNNRNIVGADFYNSKNVAFYEGKDLEVPPELFETEYEPLNQNIYQYYSLSHWISDIFENNN